MQQAVTTQSAPPPPRDGGLGRNRAWLLLLLPFVIAAGALGLRLQGIDWDGGNFYHPDERSIYMRVDCMYRTLTDAPGWEACANRDFPLDEPGFPSISTFFDKDASPLNPHWFPLGTIIIYLLVGVRFGLEAVMDQVRLQDLATAGRTIAAFVDAGSVLLLYFLGKRLFSRPVGALAAGLLALAVVNIQLTHFYRPESFVVLLALGAFWWMLNVLERGRLRDHVGLGLVIGTTFAFRGSSVPMLAPLAITYGVVAWRAWRSSGYVLLGRPIGRLLPTAYRAALAAGVALAAFAVLQPYALLDFTKYVGDLAWETSIARVAGQVPYTVQYVGTTRTGLYELQQTAVWALGLPLGVVAWAGLGLSVVRGLRRPRTAEWLLLSWVLVLVLVIVPFFEVKFLRYIAPVLPVMVLLGSRWLVEAHLWARARSSVLQRAVLAGIAVVVLATGFYALAFVNSYRLDHPGVQASAWMNANAQAGSVVLTDNHWDEGFGGLGGFSVSQLPMYEGDTLAKAQRVASDVAGADYIMAYSNRPWGSIARLPERYPFSAAYYRALFSGELGYELVASFARYPELLGVSFVHDPFTRSGLLEPAVLPGIEPSALVLDLGWADENVVNYDRPLVLVWQNTGGLTAREIVELMVLGADTGPERAMLGAAAWDEQRAGGTWTDVFSEGGLNGAAPWLVWLLAIEVVFLVSLPLAVRLMRWLPDRGVLLARPLGLLLVAWIVWMGASTGLWTFSRGSVVLAVLIVAAVSGVLLYRNRAMLVHARRHWRYLVGVEALFVGAYLVFVLIRAANPDLWDPWRGGEKPMDLSYLTAVVKSTTFPPYDPWYAGGYLNYYYFGFVMVGVLVKLTGIVPAVAYNLAVPLLFALTLTGAFSVGHNLAEALRRRGRLAVSARTTLLAGGAAALLVAVLANVEAPVQLGIRALDSLGGGVFGRFDFWPSSRMMPGQISINEFPFWTFLFADLHAHMFSLPVQLLVVGLSANVVLGAGRHLSRAWRASSVGVLALTVGSLAAINTWDVPAYGLLALGALGVAALVGSRGRPLGGEIGRWLAWSAAFALVAYAAWAPFHASYDAPFTGVHVSEWRTVLWHYLGIHALLILLVGTWVAVEAYRRFGVRPSAGSWRTAGIGAAAVAVAALVWWSAEPLRPWTTAALLAVLLAAAGALWGWWAAHRRDPQAPVQMLLLGMAVLAVGIGIGVDVVTANSDIDRMNTVFKLGLNAWVLLALVGGVGLWHLWATGGLRWSGARWPRYGRRAWLALLAVLVLGGAVFPVAGTRARLVYRFDTNLGLTLDGAAYQQVAVYGDPGPTSRQDDDVRYALREDAEALEFMRQNISGSPVVLEAATAHAYRWQPRVAAYTGLPVVVGWQWHQLQQRGAGGNEPENVRRRVRDVGEMYGTQDPRRLMQLLATYEVAYVYVGPAERANFPEAGIAKFAALAGGELELFFANDAVQVYRVAGAIQ
ncbi:MAG: glycosyltransferase family 39 protein [Chloroflexi bacterium]|nr:glycosyltransferase family 39 protein [Chloroflexota bacterium]